MKCWIIKVISLPSCKVEKAAPYIATPCMLATGDVSTGCG